MPEAFLSPVLQNCNAVVAAEIVAGGEFYLFLYLSSDFVIGDESQRWETRVRRAERLISKLPIL